MKFRNYLLGTLACAAFAACTNDDTVVNLPPGEGETEGKAYLTVNIIANNDAMTRAGSSKGFVNGTDAESEVKSARFYFFDASGQPVVVNPNGTNYIDVNNFGEWKENQQDGNNITKSTTTLVIDAKKVLPVNMITFLNPPTDVLLNDRNHGLEDLHTNHAADYAASKYTQSGTFIMSTSNYRNTDGSKHDADNIINNLQTSAEAAATNPVDVYVERVVAKVDVTQKTTDKFDTGSDFHNTPETEEAKEGPGTESDNITDIYAKIQGWDIADKKPTSWPVKQLNSSWAETTPFQNWNDFNNHRSYWAVPTDGTPYTGFTWSQVTNNGAMYLNESTAGNGNATYQTPKLFVAAQLVDKDGKALDLASYGPGIFTIEGAKTTILGVLKSGGQEIGTYIGTTFTSFTATDITFRKPTQDEITNETAKSYEAIPEVGANVTGNFAYKAADGTITETDKATVNKLLIDHPARVYPKGRTYYFTTINHLADGFPGVIRNHMYQININGIKGLGTPVFDENEPIPTPEEVVDESAYMSATINVLSWNVITNDVTLGE